MTRKPHEHSTPSDRAKRIAEANPSLSYAGSQIIEDIKSEITSAEIAAYRHAEAIVRVNLEYTRKNPGVRASDALHDVLRDIRNILGNRTLSLPGFD